MMRAKKSFKWLTTMVGIALLVVLLGAFPGYAQNAAPTDITLDSNTVDENQVIGTAVGTFTTTDPNTGDNHTYSLIAGPQGTDNGSFQISDDTLQTNAMFDYETKTSYSILVQTTDNGTPSYSYEKPFIITVTNVNEDPMDITLSSNTVDENQASGTAVGTFTTTDPDTGDTHTYSLVAGTGDTDNASFQISNNTLRTNAMFDYETKTSYSIRVRTTDSGTLTYEKPFNITVTDINDAPVGVADSISVAEGGTATTLVGGASSVLANDTDEDSGDTLTAVRVSDPANGTLTLNSDGTFSYTHDGSETTSDSFTYKANDGALDSNTATVTITITAVNDTPIVSDIPDQTIAEGGSFTTINLDDYVSDVDNTDAEATWSYSGNSELTVTIDGNRVATIGIPNADWYGSETITFTATDPGSLSDSDPATFTVNAVNDPPVANDDSDTTPEDTPVITNVVANDTDADGTVVSSAVAIVNGPSNGSVVNNGNGTVTYTPNENFYGSDSFTYTVKDNGGATSNVALVTINIGAVNDPPVAQMDSEITDESVPVTIPVLANDSDPDGDRLTVESVTQPSNGTVTNNGTDVTYSPGPDFNGSDSFTYTVSDKNGSADTARVSVEVLEGAADGEGGAYGPSEGKVKLGELVSQVRFVKRDTDNISWLVPGVPNLTVLEDSMVLEKLALSTDLQPTRYRAGAHLEVGVELPTMEERRAHGWPWIRVTSPDLAEPGNVTAGFSFSGRSADGIYWFGIDIGDVPWGRYDFWIVYGEEKMILVPIIVLP